MQHTRKFAKPLHFPNVTLSLFVFYYLYQNQLLNQSY